MNGGIQQLDPIGDIGKNSHLTYWEDSYIDEPVSETEVFRFDSLSTRDVNLTSENIEDEYVNKNDNGELNDSYSSLVDILEDLERTGAMGLHDDNVICTNEINVGFQIKDPTQEECQDVKAPPPLNRGSSGTTSIPQVMLGNGGMNGTKLVQFSRPNCQECQDVEAPSPLTGE